MNKEYKFKVLISLMFIYTIISWIYSLGTKNYEFFYYSILMFILIIILYIYHKKLNLSLRLVLLIVVLGILHILGGNIKIGNSNLYNMHFFYGLIGYDNIIHSFGSFIIVLVLYCIIAPYLHPVIRVKKIRLALLLIVMSMGIGAFVEIIELGAFLFLNDTSIGGYLNNAVDLVLNLLGSIIGAIFVVKYKENKEEIVNYYKKYAATLKLK